MNDTQEGLAFFCKKKEIESTERARKSIYNQKTYLNGKAAAFAEAWQFMVFGDRKVLGEEYNKQHNLWVERVFAESNLFPAGKPKDDEGGGE